MRALLIAGTALALCGCAGAEVEETADLARANSMRALNETLALRERVDELESRVDQLEARLGK